MLIAFSEFCMRRLCELPRGFKKSLDNMTLRLWENLDNARKGKHKLRPSTIDAMRKGEFGDSGVFVSSFGDAIEKEDIAGLTKVLNNDLDRVYGGFEDGLAAIHNMDGKISEYLISDDDEILEMLNLPLVLKTQVKDFKTGMRSSEKTKAICLFYLYFWICIESRSLGPQKPFQQIFEQEGESLYGSFIKLIRAGIRKHNHKMTEIHERLNMDFKEFDNRLRTPSRFCGPDFLRRFATAYYELCFTNENKKPRNSEVLFAVWNTVAHAVWIMDKAKQHWGIDFRNLAKRHYNEFAAAASS